MLKDFEHEVKIQAAHAYKMEDGEFLRDGDFKLEEDHLTPFYTVQQQRENTIVPVTGDDGKQHMHLAKDGNRIEEAYLPYVFFPKGMIDQKAHLIVGAENLHHSHVSAGKPVGYAGEFSINREGRLDEFSTALMETGHYQYPSRRHALAYIAEKGLEGTSTAAVILNSVTHAEAYVYKKLHHFIDEDLHEKYANYPVSTVSYGMEDQRDRIQADFADEPFGRGEQSAPPDQFGEFFDWDNAAAQ
jgi:hypothetical protein